MQIVNTIRTAPIKSIILLACLSISHYVLASDIDNARFLNQSTLGWNESELKELTELGQKRWLEQQLSKNATKLEPYISMLAARLEEDADTVAGTLPYHKVNLARNNVGYKNTTTAWMRAVLRGDDILRHRVAFALSQILVVSNCTNVLTAASANYYDLLLDNAFVNYEDLLLKVTLHPVMGKYLSYLWNRAHSEDTSQQPDENYAREVMQLFSIGLWELNKDGTRRLNKDGDPINTYEIDDVKTLARVFTGLSLKDERFGKQNWDKYSTPMIMNSRHHDKKAKNCLKRLY